MWMLGWWLRTMHVYFPFGRLRSFANKSKKIGWCVVREAIESGSSGRLGFFWCCSPWNIEWISKSWKVRAWLERFAAVAATSSGFVSLPSPWQQQNENKNGKNTILISYKYHEQQEWKADYKFMNFKCCSLVPMKFTLKSRISPKLLLLFIVWPVVIFVPALTPSLPKMGLVLY